MDAAHQSRLEQLEILYSEQDRTLDTLNETVVRQELEIARLVRRFEALHNQLQSLREGLGDNISPEFEKPPHY